MAAQVRFDGYTNRYVISTSGMCIALSPSNLRAELEATPPVEGKGPDEVGKFYFSIGSNPVVKGHVNAEGLATLRQALE